MMLLLGIVILVGVPLLCVALAYGAAGVVLMGVVGWHSMVYKDSVDDWNKALTRQMKLKAILQGAFLHVFPYAYILMFLYGITGKGALSTVCIILTGGPLFLAGIFGKK